MKKLLVNTPDGIQELIEIHESGSYYDESKVLWDERKDGVFPQVKVKDVGSLVRDGAELKASAIRKAEVDSARALLNVKSDAQLALERIKALDIDAADPALKDILIVLRSRM